MSLEYLVNKIIQLDPNTLALQQQLAGSNIAIKCKDYPNLYIYLNFDVNYVSLNRVAPETVNATIAAPLSGFIALLLQRDLSKAHTAQLTIDGNPHSAQLLQQLFFKLEIDWEEELSKITGDVLAHKISIILHRVKNYQKYSSSSLIEMITEYLQNDSEYLVSALEINDFMNEVDLLRLRVDRLESKIQNYKLKVLQHEGC